jgi:hypothetical protein
VKVKEGVFRKVWSWIKAIYRYLFKEKKLSEVLGFRSGQIGLLIYFAQIVFDVSLAQSHKVTLAPAVVFERPEELKAWMM